MTQADEVWYRLELLTAAADRLADELWKRGALGVEVQDRETFMEDAPFHPLPDGKTRLIAFFDNPFDEATLPEEVEVTSNAAYDDRSWETAWMRYFHPVRVSQHAVVGPPWEDFEAPSGGIKIVIEPGMAFGTGTHETTRVCAELLDELIHVHAPTSLLDVGCGTGVLSMVASGLGVETVRAMDIDPIAVEVARENLRLNGYEQVEVSTTPLPQFDEHDLVVANILAHILLILREDLLQRVSPGGRLLTSGITTDQADDFAERFAHPAFELTARRDLGEWVAFVWQRTAEG